MSLDELLKVIKKGTFVCVRVNHKDANREYCYPFIEQMPNEWNVYYVQSIEAHWTNDIIIDVEEVNQC